MFGRNDQHGACNILSPAIVKYGSKFDLNSKSELFQIQHEVPISDNFHTPHFHSSVECAKRHHKNGLYGSGYGNTKNDCGTP